MRLWNGSQCADVVRCFTGAICSSSQPAVIVPETIKPYGNVCLALFASLSAVSLSVRRMWYKHVNTVSNSI